MPLQNSAIDRSLVLGDRTSFREDDIISADQILPDFLGEFAHPRYRADQIWYNIQKPGEMTIFTSYDSDVPGNLGSEFFKSALIHILPSPAEFRVTYH